MGVALTLFAYAQDFLPSFELRREGRTVLVQQTARDDEGGIFASRPDGCREAGISLFTVYAPAPKRVESVMGDSMVLSNIVLRAQPRGNQNEAVLEFIAGSLTFDDETLCPIAIERTSEPLVELKQGRTTARGVEARYDNLSGRLTMMGPVRLERTAEGEAEALSATAARLELDENSSVTVLSGGVRLVSGERESEADTVEYDEEAGRAVLRGDPARSRLGSDMVEGRVIEYDLDTNDVVVRQGVRASFEINR
jgi:hypothetical protein